jgi:hypothetical protein
VGLHNIKRYEGTVYSVSLREREREKTDSEEIVFFRNSIEERKKIMKNTSGEYITSLVQITLWI